MSDLPTDETWPTLDAAGEARVLQTIVTRGPDRLPLIQLVTCVSSVVDRTSSRAAAAKHLKRSGPWLSKFVRLRRAEPQVRRWTYFAMKTGACVDAEIAYLMLQIEDHDPAEAADVFGEMQLVKLARESAPAGRRIRGVNRDDLRTRLAKVKRAGRQRAQRARRGATASKASKSVGAVRGNTRAGRTAEACPARPPRSRKG